MTNPPLACCSNSLRRETSIRQPSVRSMPAKWTRSWKKCGGQGSDCGVFQSDSNRLNWSSTSFESGPNEKGQLATNRKLATMEAAGIEPAFNFDGKNEWAC